MFPSRCVSVISVGGSDRRDVVNMMEECRCVSSLTDLHRLLLCVCHSLRSSSPMQIMHK